MEKDNSKQEGKRERVQQMFDSIAPTYDALNHILSLDIDRLWRRRVVRVVRRSKALRILDMATGTGDLAIALARRIRGSSVCAIDLSEQMLAEAKRKIERRGLDERITLSQGDVEHIPLADESVDAATVAFGVRNFASPILGLREMWRTIRQGGILVVLEFSNPTMPIVGNLYRLYFHKFLPFVGGMVSHNKQAYRYLPDSVDEFPRPDEFERMLLDAGFSSVSRRRQCFGIAQIYIAKK